MDQARERTDGTGIHPVAQARDNPANNDMGNSAGGSLEGATDAEDKTSGHDDLLPSEGLAKKECKKGTKEAALDRVRRGHPEQRAVVVSYNLIDGNTNKHISQFRAPQLCPLRRRSLHGALERSAAIATVGGVYLGECLGEGGAGEETAHDSLVIAKAGARVLAWLKTCQQREGEAKGESESESTRARELRSPGSPTEGNPHQRSGQ